mgnify:CR=1 FL=1
MPFLGLRLGNETQLSVADIQSLGTLAEEHGYGEVWMTEGAGRDSLPNLPPSLRPPAASDLERAYCPCSPGHH